MPFFHYRARNTEGKSVAGLVEAPSDQVAVRLLHEKKMVILSLKETHERFSLGSVMTRFKHVGMADIVNFTRQLSTMVTAGLMLPSALSILKTQAPNPAFRQVLGDIEHQIVSGANLADSLTKYTKYFPHTYIALVRAGETSGTLDKIFLRLADTMEAQRELRSKVVGAMIYPIIIIIGMVVVVTVMMIVVIPKLTDLYKDFGVSLPVTTQILISVSLFMVHSWYIMVGALVGLVWLFNWWKKTPVGELAVDTLILKIPLVGNLVTKIMLVEFSRTLAMLIAAGIHILEGLRILQASLGNVLFRSAISEISQKIEKGFPMGETFSEYAIFPPIVSQMMKVGEETGKIDETLIKLSEYFETETDHLVKGLTTAIEPILMIVLGVGVFFIVVSIITPIYSLTNQIK